jgi:transposase-like protein
LGVHENGAGSKERSISKRRRSWSAEQKRELVEEARAMRARGRPWSAVCRELGVLEGSLRLWMRQFPAESRPVLPVQVVRAAPAPQLLCVVTPDGIRIEGVDLDGAVQLVEMLRC